MSTLRSSVIRLAALHPGLRQDLLPLLSGRRVTAGGADFWNFVRGTNATKAFNDTVDDARHAHGHGGYSGTIAEKDGFKLRTNIPMSREQARDFIDKDINENDKFGPAFAVPIAETKVKSEKVVTLKIEARDELGATIRFKAQAKAPLGAVFSDIKVTKVKDGGQPRIETIKDTRRFFTVIDTTRGQSQIASGATKEEALQTFLKSGRANPGNTFELREVKVLSTFKVNESKDIPVWEVSGKIKVMDLGQVIGYMFYGIASS